MLCVLMNILSHASARRKTKRLTVSNFAHLGVLFPDGIVVVKGLTNLLTQTGKEVIKTAGLHLTLQHLALIVDPLSARVPKRLKRQPPTACFILIHAAYAAVSNITHAVCNN